MYEKKKYTVWDLLLADIVIIIIVAILTAPDVNYVANYENKKPQKRNQFGPHYDAVWDVYLYRRVLILTFHFSPITKRTNNGYYMTCFIVISQELTPLWIESKVTAITLV